MNEKKTWETAAERCSKLIGEEQALPEFTAVIRLAVLEHSAGVQAENDKLKAENGRLRTALERLASGDFAGTSINANSSAMILIEEALSGASPDAS